jgi:hypothetical protein
VRESQTDSFDCDCDCDFDSKAGAAKLVVALSPGGGHAGAVNPPEGKTHMAHWFFLSYARSDADVYFKRFRQKLAEAVRVKVGGDLESVAFYDRDDIVRARSGRTRFRRRSRRAAFSCRSTRAPTSRATTAGASGRSSGSGRTRSWRTERPPRLARWIDEDRAFLAFRELLRSNRSEWERSSRDAETLLAGATLQTAQQWERSRGPELTAEDRDFIAISRAGRRSKRHHRGDARRHRPASRARIPRDDVRELQTHGPARGRRSADGCREHVRGRG